jgi:hypothetical protein
MYNAFIFVKLQDPLFKEKKFPKKNDDHPKSNNVVALN